MAEGSSLLGPELFVRTWEPEGTVLAHLTFVHGLGEHVGRYEHVFSVFAARGIRVRAFDQEGHGQSPGKVGDIQFDNTLDMIQKLVTSPKDVPSFLMGHSMGGMYVLNYIVREGAAGLTGVIASAPLVTNTQPINGCVRGCATCLAKCCGTVTIDNGLNVADISRDPAEVRRYQEDPLVHSRISLNGAVAVVAGGEYLLDADVSAFKVPLLLAHGDRDGITSPVSSREFFESVPSKDKTYHSVPGGFHEIHNDPGKEDLIALYAAWMIEHARASRPAASTSEPN